MNWITFANKCECTYFTNELHRQCWQRLLKSSLCQPDCYYVFATFESTSLIANCCGLVLKLTTTAFQMAGVCFKRPTLMAANQNDYDLKKMSRTRHTLFIFMPFDLIYQICVFSKVPINSCIIKIAAFFHLITSKLHVSARLVQGLHTHISESISYSYLWLWWSSISAKLNQKAMK